MPPNDYHKAIALGASSGGIEALSSILPYVPADINAAFFVVLHISPDSDSTFVQYLKAKCRIKIVEACDTEEIKPGIAYFSPPDYHLLIEKNFTLKLSRDEKINFSRPAIDVLFETAAEAYGKRLTGILLTGANSDGSKGLQRIKQMGGITVVQSPDEAASPEMPSSAIRLFAPDHIMTLKQIGDYLRNS